MTSLNKIAVILLAILVTSCGGESEESISPPEINLVSITTTKDGEGIISPSQQNVEVGARATFTITASDGHSLSSIDGCNGKLSGNVFRTSTAINDCNIHVTFTPQATTPPISYEVTGLATVGGNISPASQRIEEGSRATLVLLPNSGFEINSVTGCAGSLSGNTYTTSPISAACAVNVTFKLKTYQATAQASTGGSVSPNSQTV
uniref:InlB B-repeat-containing protein n=1 Tax=Paraferrimonas haliotis TaxID=2013866 RepID=UPI003CC8314F